MNRKIYLALFSLAVLAVGGWIIRGQNSEVTYKPRAEVRLDETDFYHEEEGSSEGAIEYLRTVRANQFTGDIDPAWVDAAKAQVERSRALNKSDFPLQWENAGPDNVGGRTRAILVDHEDPNILFAGGVSGGLWKSTNKGASWYLVDNHAASMIVGSICQTIDGTIYYGTGERFGNVTGTEYGSPGFPGEGIFRSTDGGETFEQLATTRSWNFVSDMVAHPKTNTVFAATENGLKYSDDGGATWKNSRTGDARDLSIDKNGNMLMYLSGSIWRSTDPTNGSSFTRVTGIPGGVRMGVAHSETDPNYAYAVVVGNVTINTPSQTVTLGDALVGIYQSKDNGATFEQIVSKANTYFAPFTQTNFSQAQGTWDLCIAVHPRNKERIFIGGVFFAEWTPEGGPRIVGNNFDHPTNPLGIHADKHNIRFDTMSDPMIMYIVSDGGVTKTTNAAMSKYATIENGYQTTQFYGISASRDGKLVGGCQDNGSILIDGKGNTPLSGVEIRSGDGFRALFSQENNDVLFCQSQYGSMGRSINSGSSQSSIFDERIKTNFVTATETREQPSNIFNTPLALFEDPNGPMNRLFFPLNGEVWMAEDAVTSPTPTWYRVARTNWDPHQLAVTPDGASLFIGANNSTRLVRVDGLLKAQFDTASLDATQISDSLKMVDISSGLPGGRSITDIEVDPNDGNRVIVTLGNFGNSSYIYITEDALSASPTWKNIQGTLPQAPIYDALISATNPDEIVIGTEYGIWATQNGTSASPSWTTENDNFPTVPVFCLAASEAVKRETWRTGQMLYAGTHGLGIWKTAGLLTSVQKVAKEDVLNVNLYPNPVQDKVTATFKAKSADKVTVSVTDLLGRVIQTETVSIYSAGNAEVSMNLNGMETGTYFLNISGKNHSGAVKFIKAN